MSRVRPPGPPPPAPNHPPSPEPKPTEQRTKKGARKKRSWKLRLGELALWTAVAVLTAVVLVNLSERILPANF